MTRTTTSCGAIALALLANCALLAQTKPATPLSLFPVTAAWNTPVDATLTAPPRLAGHLAFLPVDGEHLSAYDLLTGARSWSIECHPLSPPAVSDSLVFVAEPDAISAFRQSDGTREWRVPFSEPLATPLVWDNGWLVAVNADATLLAFRAVDGALIWRHELPGRVNAPPSLASNRVYVPLADGHVVALEIATGTELWSRRLGGAANDLLALDRTVFAGSDDNYFYSLKASDGTINWRWRTGGDVIGVPVVDERRVYFVSKDNVVRALDRKSGSQRWKRELPGRPTRGLVQAGTVLLVSGLSPKVTAISIADGTPAGEVVSPGELAASPFVIVERSLPHVFLVARDLAAGTRLLAFRRNVEPVLNAPLSAIPNPIPALRVGPATATSAAPSAPPLPPDPTRRRP